MPRTLSYYFNVMLVLISISSLTSIILLFKHNKLDRNYYSYFFMPQPQRVSSNVTVNIKYVNCEILSQKDLVCISDDKNDIFLPFEIMRKKFDLELKKDQNDASVSFSSSKVYYPQIDYDSADEYLWFSSIFVESRDRVKQISLEHGVPISSQWNKSGHFYPIQVCQFGLSHFSRGILEKKLNRAKPVYSQKFIVYGKSKFIHHENENAFVKSYENGFEFKFKDKAIYKTNYTFDIRYISAELRTNSYFELKFDLMLRDLDLVNGNFIVRLIYAFNSTFEKNEKVSESFVKIINSDQTYKVVYKINGGISSDDKKPLFFIRNICLDACKGLQLKCENCYKPLNETMILTNGTINNHTFISQYYKVYQISLKGEGEIKNGVLSEEPVYFDLAKLAGDYLVTSQSVKTGGWPINVTRKFDTKSNVYLNKGWYSAMGQGHALSLLCRLYNHSKNENYLRSAVEALRLYDINVENGGIRTYFLNTSLIWFEEYPTRPNSLFVLNGFIYSIIGLNDFLNGCVGNSIEILTESNKNKVKTLFADAIRSLNQLINLYDTGTRTLYDLRHVISPIVNPNVARWDYHALHISLLNYLANMIKVSMPDTASSFENVANRWVEYMKGISNKNTQIKFF